MGNDRDDRFAQEVNIASDREELDTAAVKMAGSSMQIQLAPSETKPYTRSVFPEKVF